MTLDVVLLALAVAKKSARTATDAALVAETETRNALVELDELQHALTLHKAELGRVAEPELPEHEVIDQLHYDNFSTLFGENRRMMAYQYAHLGKVIPAGWFSRFEGDIVTDHFAAQHDLYDGWLAAGKGNIVLSEPDFARMLKMAIAANKGMVVM